MLSYRRIYLTAAGSAAIVGATVACRLLAPEARRTLDWRFLVPEEVRNAELTDVAGPIRHTTKILYANKNMTLWFNHIARVMNEPVLRPAGTHLGTIYIEREDKPLENIVVDLVEAPYYPQVFPLREGSVLLVTYVHQGGDPDSSLSKYRVSVSLITERATREVFSKVFEPLTVDANGHGRRLYTLLALEEDKVFLVGAAIGMPRSRRKLSITPWDEQYMWDANANTFRRIADE